LQHKIFVCNYASFQLSVICAALVNSDDDDFTLSVCRMHDTVSFELYPVVFSFLVILFYFWLSAVE